MGLNTWLGIKNLGKWGFLVWNGFFKGIVNLGVRYGSLGFLQIDNWSFIVIIMRSEVLEQNEVRIVVESFRIEGN